MVQKVVNTDIPVGVPGGLVALQEEYTPFNYISDGTLHAGGFAFISEEKFTPETAVDMPVAGAKGKTLLGVVLRSFTAGVVNLKDPCTYEKGEEVSVICEGDVYIKAPASAEVGKHILVDPKTGKVTCGDAGTDNDTGWIIKTKGDENDIIVISNRGGEAKASEAV